MKMPSNTYFKNQMMSSLVRRDTTKTTRQAQPNQPTLLQTLEAQQAADLENFKRQQAVARAQEIAREQQASVSSSSASPKLATDPKVSNLGLVETSNQTSKQSQSSEAEAQQQQTSAQNSANKTLQRGVGQTNSTLVSGPSSISSNNSLNKTTLPPVLSPVNVSQPFLANSTKTNNTESIAISDHQSRVQSGKSLSITVIVLIIFLAMFFGAVFFVLRNWWRRRLEENTQRSVAKIDIKGPFKKSGGDEDDEGVFGGLERTDISFGGLEINRDKGCDFQLQSNQFNKINNYHPPLPISKPILSPIYSGNTLSESSQVPEYKQNLSEYEDSTKGSAKDHSPNVELSGGLQDLNGQTFVVQRTFQAALADELIIFIGDRIKVNLCYDDGWCLGENLDSEKHGAAILSKGVFPRDCISTQLIQPLKTPTLPPLDLGKDYSPVNQDSEIYNANNIPLGSSFNSEVLTQFPAPPTAHGVRTTQRISSLFAGRDAELFLELGEALGKTLK
ncbi:hypothetical protein BY996DRAFT_1423072 [Phakopsora pachyrhizi]|uniref:Expressed protein n=1 Tax=Phakopsora pachyrhizi TaxID=170000 RepID=A0AAV0AXU8_PHAPC|nr:hypothetical protein BY996DRAFT_1423072 [Phakopsora pachyrhizi]CAH7675203.1 expressed protein [Phakopsora pachyrhizi]